LTEVEESLNYQKMPAETDRVLALAALGLLAGSAALGPDAGAAGWIVAGASMVLAIVAIRLQSAASGSIAALVAAFAVASRGPQPWQATMAIALVAFAVVVRVLPGVAPGPRWCSLGRPTLGWAALVGGVTPVALMVWIAALHPDLSDVRAMIPDLPLAALVAGGVAFALVNATLEELVWRGVLQDRLGVLFGSGGAIALQAASFGLHHVHGVPRGAVGILLAGAWAAMLGLLRRRSGGLLAPILAHVVADATIAIIVLLGLA
jgi:hypothetical protein